MVLLFDSRRQHRKGALAAPHRIFFVSALGRESGVALEMLVASVEPVS
jgi:hypothetical protein